MIKRIFQLSGPIRQGVLAIALLFFAIPSHATKYWVSKSTGNWNNTFNWSTVSGGAGHAGVPVSTDSVVFDGNAIGTCTVNVNVTVSSFTISTNSVGGYTSSVLELSTASIAANLDFAINNGTFSAQTSSMTVSSSVAINGGYVALAGSSVTAEGNWTMAAAATFLPGTSTVTFSSSTLNLTITNNNHNFSNVLFAGGAGSWILQDSMTVTSTMTFNKGTLDTSGCAGASCNVAVGGSWYILGGTFTANSSTVTFTAGSPQKIKSGGENFSNLQFNGAGGSWVLQDSMTVTSTMTLSAGTLNTKTGNTNNPISVGGSWYNTVGSFTANASTVSFTATSPGMTISSRGFPFSTAYFGPGSSGGYWTLASSLTVSTATIMSGNTLSLAGQGLKISSFTNAGSFVLQSLEGVTGAPLNMVGSSVTYTATSGSPIVFSSWTYSNLIINGGAATIFSVATPSITVNGSLSLSGGTLDTTAGNFPIGVGQSWIYSTGAFNARSSTVTFTGSTVSNTIKTGGYPFSNLQMGGTGTWIMQDSMTVTSTMTFSSGTLSSSSNCPGSTPCNVSAGGSWYVLGGTFTAASSTVTFTAGSAQKIRSGGESFYNLQLNGTNGSWVLQDSMTVTSTITLSLGTLNTKTGNINNPISVGGSWYNTAGSFTANASTVSFTATSPAITIYSRGFPFSTVYFGPGSSGGYWTLASSLTVSTVTIMSGNTLSLAGQGLQISSFTNAGSFILQSLEGVTSAPLNMIGSSVTYTATSGSPIVFSTWTYSNLIINGGAATIFSVASPSITVNGSLSLSGGTLDTTAGNFPIGVGQSWIYSTGAFNARSSTVTLTGSTASNTIKTGGFPFYNLQTTGSGIWVMQDSMTVTSTMTFSNGTLSSSSNCPGSTPCNVSVGGSWYVLGGTFTAVSSTVTFTAGSAQQIRSGGGSFNNLQFNGNNGIWVILDSMTVTSSFVLSAGSFTTNANLSYGMSVGGNWNFNGGSLVLNQSTVTLTGAGAASLTGSTTFYSLSCTVPAKSITFPINSTQTVTGLLTLTGASGNLIQVKSSQSGQLAYLKNTGTNSVSFVNAVDNNANAGITIAADTNSTLSNTFNWINSAPTLSVTLSPKPYDFTTVNIAGTTVSTSAIVVNNSGNVSETYSLSVATTGAQTVWSVGTTVPSYNTFVLFGGFNSAQPLWSNFIAGDVVISTPTAASPTVYALNQTGYRTLATSSTDLWLRLDMPLTTSTTIQQLMSVTVSASYP